MPQQIDVLRYDAVVEILRDHPGLSFPEVARRSGVAESTVRRIWNGDISRPPAVVLERLTKPRRCKDCGALCSEWPCVLCSMRQRKAPVGVAPRPTRFVYRRQSK
ncbi:MAG: helix-turn-helix domain-containing protein [Pirellulaceae bacterium]